MKRSQRSALRPALSCAMFGAVAMLGISSNAYADDDGMSIRLKPFEEVPSVSSTASGRFKASIDKRTNTIRYELSFKGLQGAVRQSHIHIGQKSVNGGIMVFLCQTAANPDPTGLAPTCPQEGSVSGVIHAANIVGSAAAQGVVAGEIDEAIAAIRAGVAYVNVHSSTFPGGEIRGQLGDDD